MVNVLGLCEQLESLLVSLKQAQFVEIYGKVIAIYTLYGRPFSQEKNSTRIDCAEVVPDDLQELHKTAMNFRNKLFSHVDVGTAGIVDDNNEAAVSIVLINKRPDLYATMEMIVPSIEVVGEIKNLAITVQRSCRERLQRIWEPFQSQLEELSETYYHLNVDAERHAPMFRLRKK